jgi:hypothetical protein
MADRDSRSEILFMLISAGLFAYFGWGVSWVHKYTTTQPPQLLPMVVLLQWTMRGGAIAFGLAALISMLGSSIGSFVYAGAGLATAVIFLIVAIWEWTNPQGYYSGVPAILLLVFAVWNGYGSWSSLREALASMRSRPQVLRDERFMPPGA